MNNQRGITLISLIVTVIVLVIIATITTYSGIESIDITKQQVFISELEMIQAKVNAIYEKRKSSEVEKAYYDNLGKDLSTISSSKVDSALNGETSNGYKYFSKTDLKQIELENITQDVLINFDTRSVVSLNGISIDGTVYYRLKDIPTYTGQNIEYTDKNTEVPTFEVKIEPLESSWNMKIQNVQYKGNVYGGTFSYRSGLTLEEIENKSWIIFNGQEFEAKDPGIYQIKLVDKAGNETIVEQYAYIKNGLVAYYDGENNTGNGHDNTATTWKDLSGNENDGILENFAYTQESGWNNSSITLDGTDDYITISNIKMSTFNEITISSTYSVLGLHNISVETPSIVCSNEAGAGRIFFGYFVTASSSMYAINFSKPDTWINTGTNDMKLNTIKNVTATYKGTNSDERDNQIIVNGEIKQTNTATLESGWSDYTLEIGRSWSGNYTNHPNSNVKINTLTIYNRMLTDAEMQINYKIDKYRFNI